MKIDNDTKKNQWNFVAVTHLLRFCQCDRHNRRRRQGGAELRERGGGSKMAKKKRRKLGLHCKY